MKKQLKLCKKRNPVALSPYLKKGGVHEKSNKAKRLKQKSQTRKEVSQYCKERFTRSFSFLIKSFLKTL